MLAMKINFLFFFFFWYFFQSKNTSFGLFVFASCKPVLISENRYKNGNINQN